MHVAGSVTALAVTIHIETFLTLCEVSINANTQYTVSLDPVSNVKLSYIHHTECQTLLYWEYTLYREKHTHASMQYV